VIERLSHLPLSSSAPEAAQDDEREHSIHAAMMEAGENVNILVRELGVSR
jgi:hypothetical protein